MWPVIGVYEVEPAYHNFPKPKESPLQNFYQVHFHLILKLEND